MKRGTVPVLVLAVVLAATGCAAAPGMHMREDRLKDGGAGGPALVPLTPAVLAALREEKARAVVPPPADPRAAEADAYEYRVAPYDVLSVIVWDHPELTIPAGEYRAPEASGNRVGADGTMFYPHVGVVKVGGLTLREIRELLTDRIRVFIEKPQLDVRVASFRGRRVYVTGEVLQPGVLPVTDVPMRLADAVAQSRGLTPNAFARTVTLTRAGTTHVLDLVALYQRGDTTQNWLLEDGDVVNVPSRESYKVYVLGEVKQPRSQLMVNGRMTLADALGDASGLDPTTSAGAVYVIRGKFDAPRVFKLDARTPESLLLATQLELEPLDVVWVDPYGLTTWNRIVTQVLPTVQGVWQSVDLANRGNQLITNP